MKVTNEVLHVENKIAKNGSRYKLVHILLNIGGQEYVRRFAIFAAVEPRPESKFQDWDSDLAKELKRKKARR